MKKSEAKKLKKQIQEKFNEIAILLRDIEEEHETCYEEDDNEDFVEVPNPDYYPENRYLLISKHIAQDLASDNEYSDVMQYYSSYCF